MEVLRNYSLGSLEHKMKRMLNFVLFFVKYEVKVEKKEKSVTFFDK